MATLFPYLETLRDHLVRSDTASPFSGAATQRNRRPLKNRKGKQQQQQQKPQQQQQQQQPQQNRYPKWGPNGPVAFNAAPPAPTIADVTPYVVVEIQRRAFRYAGSPHPPG